MSNQISLSPITDSYKDLRRMIGVLGILLPFVCVIGGYIFANYHIQDSISDYYYTNMRDFFVGLMVTVALFMMTYKGYGLTDTVLTSVIGFFGLCIPFFPCSHNPAIQVGIFNINSGITNIIHTASAIIFFILLAINSIFLFTKTDPTKEMTQNKKIRNLIYVLCGIVILGTMVVTGLLKLTLGNEIFNEGKCTLIAETIMLFAFGFSWLVKGETLFRD